MTAMCSIKSESHPFSISLHCFAIMFSPLPIHPSWKLQYLTNDVQELHPWQRLSMCWCGSATSWCSCACIASFVTPFPSWKDIIFLPSFICPSYFPCRREVEYNVTNLAEPANGTFPLAECACTPGEQSCPADAGRPVPPLVRISTSDVIFNVSDRNPNDWIVNTHQAMKLIR